jgi:hypothetical protein
MIVVGGAIETKCTAAERSMMVNRSTVSDGEQRVATDMGATGT